MLNEREIRAAAGLLFLATYTSVMLITFREKYIMFKYVITLFLADFLIRVCVNPRYSPTLILGRLIVRNQVPEYVGAKQKRLAWVMGVILSGTIFIFMVLANISGLVSGIICLICLVFLFFESVFGICLGCKFYPLFFKDKARYCPGEVCARKDRQEIQNTSRAQVLVAVVFFTCILVGLHFFQDALSQEPHPLFAPGRTKQAK